MTRMATDAKALISAYILVIRGEAPLSAFCLPCPPKARRRRVPFPHPTPYGPASYQISHREKFENDAASPIPHWPCAAPAIGERDRPDRTRRRPAEVVPFVSFCRRFPPICNLQFAICNWAVPY